MKNALPSTQSIQQSADLSYLWERFQHTHDRYEEQQTQLRREVMNRAYNAFMAMSRSGGK